MEGPKSDSSRDHDEVVKVLERFQEGYTSRDVASVDTYVQELFVEDSIVIGTGVDEWCFGIDDVKQLVESDWREWGDLRVELEKAVVSVAHNTAWMAMSGTVSLDQVYPIRVAGGLVRELGTWKFKHMCFSYPHPRKPVNDV